MDFHTTYRLALRDISTYTIKQHNLLPHNLYYSNLQNRVLVLDTNNIAYLTWRVKIDEATREHSSQSRATAHAKMDPDTLK
jgi:hypothetical protein